MNSRCAFRQSAILFGTGTNVQRRNGGVGAPPKSLTRQRRGASSRAHVRGTLYMATLVATRYNPVIKTFYRRLRDGGKPAKVALVAAMRKLLTILNAIMRTKQPWTVEPA